MDLELCTVNCKKNHVINPTLNKDWLLPKDDYQAKILNMHDLSRSWTTKISATVCFARITGLVVETQSPSNFNLHGMEPGWIRPGLYGCHDNHRHVSGDFRPEWTHLWLCPCLRAVAIWSRWVGKALLATLCHSQITFWSNV